jgi:hypothetical protein
MINLKDTAAYYGYDFVDLSDHPNYRGRKGKTWGLIDRRDGLLWCAYSTKAQIQTQLLKIGK